LQTNCAIEELRRTNDPAANLKWFEKVRLELDRWMNPAAAVRSTRKTGHFDIVFG
jgi:hypothetical protein